MSHAPDCAEISETGLADADGGGVFADIDSALEWCEDRVLREHAITPAESRRVPLGAMDGLRGFTEAEIALLGSIVEEVDYPRGALIIREGDVADSLYMLSAARVSICLTLKNNARRQRLGTITPGLISGELDSRRRHALRRRDRRGAGALLCSADRQASKAGQAASGNRKKSIGNIARELARRLRRADAEIRSLAD